MPIASTFYDTTAGEGVKETTWAQSALSRGGSPFGVVGSGDFNVTAHPSTAYTVNVSAGKAFGYGIWDEHTGTTAVTTTAPAAGATRWDLLALRRDWQPTGGGPSSLVVVRGTTSQVIPAAMEKRPGIVADQPLWLIQWQGGQTSPRAIIDLRCWVGPGGVEIAHERARDYLALPGASVRLDGKTWNYTRQKPYANDVWGWNRAAIMQYGNVGVATNNAGDAYFNFPEPFPTALDNVVVTDSTSPVTWPPMVLKWAPQYSSTSRAAVRIYNMNGVALSDRTGLWLSYVATGR